MDFKGFEHIFSKIKNNKPQDELIYSFKENDTEITTNNKKERKELQFEIKNVKYNDFVQINRETEEVFSKFADKELTEETVAQLYKFPLIGFHIKVKLGGKRREGIIVHESKHRIYFVMSNDQVKQFDKKTKNFLIVVQGQNILVIGKNLKMSRLL